MTACIHLQSDGFSYLNIVLWNQPNISSGVLCFNPATSDILKGQTKMELRPSSWQKTTAWAEETIQVEVLIGTTAAKKVNNDP